MRQEMPRMHPDGNQWNESYAHFNHYESRPRPPWMNGAQVNSRQIKSREVEKEDEETDWGKIMKQADDFDKKRKKRKNPFFKGKPKQQAKKKKIVIEREIRAKGLQKAIPKTNKGYQMLAKMGYKQGQQLGKTRTGLTEPVKINRIREKNQGLGSGIDPASFPKLDDQLLADYRERHRLRYHSLEASAENKNLLEKAKEVCSQLESQAAVSANTKTKAAEGFDHESVPLSEVQLKGGMNYVGMVAEMCQKLRIEKPSVSYAEREGLWHCGLSIIINKQPFQCQCAARSKKQAKKMVHAVLLSRIAQNPNRELEDHIQSFNYKSCKRLDHIVDYLRTRHFHCFWCQRTYESLNHMMRSCPGPDRALHPGFEVFDDAEIKRSVKF